MDYTQQSPNILSLCTGGLRGLEVGFDAACKHFNWKQSNTIAYVEIEAFIIENLVQQMEQGVLAPALIWSNVKTFNPSPFKNKIDGIFGGYPCQPFSVAGSRKGTADPRHLWPYIERIIQTTRPVFCFFENVAGHLTMGFPEVYASLRNLGYAVEAGIFTAEEVGATHKRERLFILAIRQDQLDDAKSINRRLQLLAGRSQQSNFEPFGTSEAELGNTTSDGFKKSGHAGQRELSTKDRTGIYNRSQQPGDELADSNESRHEGRELNGTPANGQPREPASQLHKANVQWPARPNEQQHEWEHPRIESRMGFTVNGYNYREDLLRMAGNGVVWQTAELAFIDLLKNHYTNGRK